MSTVMEAVSTCPILNGYTFDPGVLIRAVNLLRRRPAAEVVAGLREYAAALEAEPEAQAIEGTRLLLLMRGLFAPRAAGTFPPIGIGRLDDVAPPAAQVWPLYPLILWQDVPLLVVPGFAVSGPPPDLLAQIAFCQQRCHLREVALRPPDDPLSLADEIIDSSLWYRPPAMREQDRAMLRAQLLRLVATTYAVPDSAEILFFSQLGETQSWDKHQRGFARLNARWSGQKNEYLALKRRKGGTAND